jgi:hypothetical protein
MKQTARGIPCRIVTVCTVAAISVFPAVAPAGAQQMRAPVGPVTIVVGSGAGATPDVLMRRVAKVLRSADRHQSIVVENRTGGAWIRPRTTSSAVAATNTLLAYCRLSSTPVVRAHEYLRSPHSAALSRQDRPGADGVAVVAGRPGRPGQAREAEGTHVAIAAPMSDPPTGWWRSSARGRRPAELRAV